MPEQTQEHVFLVGNIEGFEQFDKPVVYSIVGMNQLVQRSMPVVKEFIVSLHVCLSLFSGNKWVKCFNLFKIVFVNTNIIIKQPIIKVERTSLNSMSIFCQFKQGNRCYAVFLTYLYYKLKHIKIYDRH